jgi:hypothetical protein
MVVDQILYCGSIKKEIQTITVRDYIVNTDNIEYAYSKTVLPHFISKGRLRYR